ncbi:MAG TPA: dihydroorotase, partial [Gammaproteobacteria bacterium]|nr:dihydroorotase [Gammaproteobacteria bacterium]
ARGGITTLCCPPDTDPVVDAPAVVELIHRRADQAGHARVFAEGALTRGLEGEQLAAMQALRDAGCVAVGNAQTPMRDTLVLRRALEYAASLDLPVMVYSEDPWLGASGWMHEGAVSVRLGLAGVPACAEVVAVARDLLLIEQTGVRAHFCQLSTARGAEMVAEARARGLPVSADVAAHQLYLTEMDVMAFDNACHVRPPLRSQRDREGLRTALADGVITAVCSDHQPHDLDAKLAPFSSSEPGISGLETLLPLTLRLADEEVLPLLDAVAALTTGPAGALRLDAGGLAPGARADVCVVDPERWWTVTGESLWSAGKNSPFLGWELKGQVSHTLLEGRLVYDRDADTA